MAHFDLLYTVKWSQILFLKKHYLLTLFSNSDWLSLTWFLPCFSDIRVTEDMEAAGAHSNTPYDTFKIINTLLFLASEENSIESLLNILDSLI